MIKQLKIQVSGRVQGVGFRFFTQQKAKKLGLLGYVKNLDNGDVEILVQGDSLQITQFTEWLNHGGPSSARISNVSIYELIPDIDLTSFNVRY
ncbi:acylphosphatase [Gilliamella sp. B2776]|uniref:acylphosphatase n=1 Tax=unclassified Gilliamella TaxID=2685620 RepID=UPI00226AC491|nr:MULTISPECIES: acylphosphatase [unclassified Gilliamella]MCX8648942.1 acylphosphatase [Gilliamella sp. B2779]MCX8653182.1 acylphosphatase [Gilliamella sp. B2737]MCX8655442.1 acylphosphatase [Gilliamella sp. B2894]MCX8664207.1 acylphosphatase [Gilliamella sp. B2887]MCX8690754.1 acylphosphatase [Gilliamella sp. B2776]